jgi:hypothetical protein
MCLSVIIYKSFFKNDGRTKWQKFKSLRFYQKLFLLSIIFLSTFSLILAFSAITGFENKQIRFARDVQNKVSKNIIYYLPGKIGKKVQNVSDKVEQIESNVHNDLTKNLNHFQNNIENSIDEVQKQIIGLENLNKYEEQNQITISQPITNK